MRLSLCLALLTFALLARAAQAGELRRFTFTRPTMGTLFTATLYGEDEALATKAGQAALDRVEAINQIASDYLPESELSRWNRAPDHQAIPVSEDLFRLIAFSVKTAEITDGAFDITCTYAVQLWRRARRQHKMPTAEQLSHAVALTDWKALQLDPAKRTVTKLKPGLLIDLGGIGKGYAANEALLVLRRLGFNRALVAGSGDIAIGDPPPNEGGWEVGLRTFEKPEDQDRLFHVRLKNCGCSTSGDLHQFFDLDGKRYSHIIDPKTGLGLTKRIACTVIAPDAFWSDAFDTPMCILGVEKGMSTAAKLDGVQVRFVTLGDDGAMKVTASAGFPKE